MRKLKVAISCDGTVVSEHFGRCEKYIVFEEEKSELKSRTELKNPGHAPFFLPKFLAKKGVRKIICKGIGPKAMDLFKDLGIEVVAGVEGSIEEVIEKYLNNDLEAKDSTCNHIS